MRNYFLGLCLLFALCFTACSHSDDSVDVLIIGGGASGVLLVFSLLEWGLQH